VAHLENPAADYSAKQFSLTMMVNLTARKSRQNICNETKLIILRIRSVRAGRQEENVPYLLAYY
jgi:hypothetical protein